MDKDHEHHWSRRIAFAACVAALLIAWLDGLPRLARQPRIAAYIARNEARGINPAAKFYTEHEVTQTGLRHVDAARRADVNAWW